MRPLWPLLGAKIRILDSKVYKTKLSGSTYLNENMVGNIVLGSGTPYSVSDNKETLSLRQKINLQNLWMKIINWQNCTFCKKFKPLLNYNIAFSFSETTTQFRSQ